MEKLKSKVLVIQETTTNSEGTKIIRIKNKPCERFLKLKIDYLLKKKHDPFYLGVMNIVAAYALNNDGSITSEQMTCAIESCSKITHSRAKHIVIELKNRDYIKPLKKGKYLINPHFITNVTPYFEFKLFETWDKL